MVYKVDDRTGPLVDVKKWLDDKEWKAELNLRAQCRWECMGVCIGNECVCVNGCKKEDHIVHCRQVVS